MSNVLMFRPRMNAPAPLPAHIRPAFVNLCVRSTKERKRLFSDREPSAGTLSFHGYDRWSERGRQELEFAFELRPLSAEWSELHIEGFDIDQVIPVRLWLNKGHLQWRFHCSTCCAL